MKPFSLIYLESIKVVLVGNSGVGKTSLVQRFTQNKFSDSKLCTIGVECNSKEITISN